MGKVTKTFPVSASIIAMNLLRHPMNRRRVAVSMAMPVGGRVEF